MMIKVMSLSTICTRMIFFKYVTHNNVIVMAIYTGDYDCSSSNGSSLMSLQQYIV